MFNTNKIYNAANWDINLYIYNVDIYEELYDRSLVDGLTADTMIISRNILYISLDNSIESFFPKLKIKIIDNQMAVSNNLRRQNTLLKLTIEQLLNVGSEKPTDQKVELVFVLSEYKILDFSIESVTYEIEGILDTSILLNRACTYATIPEDPENPLNIAYSILKANNYPLYQTEIEIEEGKIPTRWYPPQVETKINFITYQNMRALDALKYLLSITGKNCENPIYLIHNLTDNKAFFSTRSHMMRDDWLKNAPGVTKVPFNFSSNIIGNSHIMKFLRSNGIIGGVESTHLMINYMFSEYNHINREWTSTFFPRDVINDSLTEFKNTEEKSLLNYGTVSDIDYNAEFVPYSEQHINDVMRDLDLYSSNLQFTVEGNLKLDVGEMIEIGELIPDRSKNEQFYGIWMISKVHHTYKDQLFKTNIICSRVTYLKNQAVTGF